MSYLNKEKKLDIDFLYCSNCGSLRSQIAPWVLSKYFGQIEIENVNIHRSAQARIIKMGKELGFDTIYDYEVSDLLKEGKNNFIDVVWTLKGGVIAAFEIRTKEQNLGIITSKKDVKKLENLNIPEKFIVNISTISGKAYFNKITNKSIENKNQLKVDSKVSFNLQQTTKNTFEDIRKIYPKHYKKWTIEEDINLIDNYKNGNSINELAKVHERKPGAIQKRLITLGLIQDPYLKKYYSYT